MIVFTKVSTQGNPLSSAVRGDFVPGTKSRTIYSRPALLSQPICRVTDELLPGVVIHKE